MTSIENWVVVRHEPEIDTRLQGNDSSQLTFNRRYVTRGRCFAALRNSVTTKQEVCELWQKEMEKRLV
ncbi:hypothetical protein F2P81_006102 [Scophthalmus maximus]|uniref:Uncharacterized protein n=1 Tax=Scophthalmus maximus TaxID=52904 RepID=A0A6A4TFP2_SCOMX|nr:hypothetical protein F2P81_006102 [Scophthalmus maximus]